MREYEECDYDAEIKGVENQIQSNQDYYETLSQQIGELSQDKELYDEDEWNSIYDEKSSAQSDATNRIYELQGQLNDLHRERDEQVDTAYGDAIEEQFEDENQETLDNGDILEESYQEEIELESDISVDELDGTDESDTEDLESDSDFDAEDIMEDSDDDITFDAEELSNAPNDSYE